MDVVKKILAVTMACVLLFSGCSAANNIQTQQEYSPTAEMDNKSTVEEQITTPSKETIDSTVAPSFSVDDKAIAARREKIR